MLWAKMPKLSSAAVWMNPLLSTVTSAPMPPAPPLWAWSVGRPRLTPGISSKRRTLPAAPPPPLTLCANTPCADAPKVVRFDAFVTVTSAPSPPAPELPPMATLPSAPALASPPVGALLTNPTDSPPPPPTLWAKIADAANPLVVMALRL
jgi:hypothetical protein